MSAYGGVIAVNRRVDLACAQALSKQFIEVLLAPGYDADALELLKEKKNVRLLELADWSVRRQGYGAEARDRRRARSGPRHRGGGA